MANEATECPADDVHAHQAGVECGSSALIVGYGNLSRRDDGVAFHVIRALRTRLGLPTPLLDDDYHDMGDNLAIVCLHQLAPELSETLSEYDVVVFIDAHADSADWAPVEWRVVTPAYRLGLVTHHLKPGAVLALCRSLFGDCPRGYILSVLGVDFDFGDNLSSTTSALVDLAVDRLMNLLRSESVVPH